MNPARAHRAWLALLVTMLVCVLAYAPGLRGSFVFDDSTFIIANKAIRVTTSRLGDWAAAALSFPSGHQGRWLGMLSFAANHYFTGLDPYWLKATNLVIHLLNGLLVFGLLRSVFALRRDMQVGYANAAPGFDGPLAAAAIASLWLVLPINLTGVLYISQRLESLSSLFVFAGLWWYVAARRARWSGSGSRIGWIAAGLLLPTAIGVTVKESAVMLPLYALCIEVALPALRQRDGSPDRAIRVLFGALIGLPLVAGGLWLATWLGGASTYARSFGTYERLLTEARVLVNYVQWTLVPLPDSLTLYHDDIAVSRGLLQPASTLASIAALTALAGCALWQRARRPLFALGIGWFFAGHLLTGTVIPLMLAFEHRNYFPSVGMLVAAASALCLDGPLQRSRLRVALATAAFAFYAFTTWMRADEWSDPLRLAVSEAGKRPDSSAAQYDLGRLLLGARRAADGRPMTTEAFQALERGARIPGGDILCEELMIVTRAQRGEPVDPAWWASLLGKLRARSPTTADIAGLLDLQRCFHDGTCRGPTQPLQDAFEAAAAHPNPDGVLLSAYGQFIEAYLDRPDLAERQFRAALAVAPAEPMTHVNLIVFLQHHGRLAEARQELAHLHTLNRLGALDTTIDELQTLLDASPRPEP